MKRNIWWGFFILLILFLFLTIRFGNNPKIEVVENKVNEDWVELIKVVDGDTIVVKIDDKTESVRLIGIDAPEMDENTKEKAIESKKYLENLLKNQKIYLEKDETQDGRDVYNRLLRYVYLRDRTLINKKMIEADMADEYTFIHPYKYQREFKEAEE